MWFKTGARKGFRMGDMAVPSWSPAEETVQQLWRAPDAWLVGVALVVAVIVEPHP